MKFNKSILILLTLFFVTVTSAQERNLETPFSVNLGVNFINTSGDRNPISFKDIAFKNPLEFGFGYELSTKIGLYTNLSFNKLSKNLVVDSGTIKSDINYFSIDLGARYYLYVWDLDRYSSIELFVQGGAGLFNLEETSTTLNLGTGAKYWFNNSIGVYIIPMAKFALDNKSVQSNHFQYSLGLLYRF